MKILIVESDSGIIVMLRAFIERACGIPDGDILVASSAKDIGKLVIAKEKVGLALCADRLFSVPTGGLIETVRATWPAALLCLMSDGSGQRARSIADFFIEKTDLVDRLREIVDAARRRAAR